jgi:DNA-binding NarL/FixJ family response regulator
VIRVLLADDDALVRAGLSLIIDTTDDITVVGEAASGDEAVDAAVRLRPDIVLMDVQMPDCDGIDATRRIVAHVGDTTKVIVVTTFEHDSYVFESIRAGASGYVLKRSRPAELTDAIRLVATGDALLSPSVTRRLIERFADIPAARDPDAELATLTDREREVLACVARGLTNSEIATQMHISESTAKTHLKRILMKLRLRDRVAAVVFAYEIGLVRPGSRRPAS